MAPKNHQNIHKEIVDQMSLPHLAQSRFCFSPLSRQQEGKSNQGSLAEDFKSTVNAPLWSATVFSVKNLRVAKSCYLIVLGQLFLLASIEHLEKTEGSGPNYGIFNILKIMRFL